MDFFQYVRVIKKSTDPISFDICWTIAEDELNTVAKTSMVSLNNSEILADMYREVAWSMQAVTEFTDLVSCNNYSNENLKQSNFLFYEAVAALREATVGMLNGSPRASMGLLRSVLEMMMLHVWWQVKSKNDKNTDKFRNWLNGQKNSPNIHDVIKDNLRNLEIPADELDFDSVKNIYIQLCSYVHAPIFRESMTTLNRGNLSDVRIEVWQNFMNLSRDVLGVVIVHLIHLYPQCLFPVNIVTKFGFNPPVGLYFDEFNFVPIQAIIDEAQLETYRTRLQDHYLVQLGKQWYESLSDLTDEEIRQTWNNPDNKREHLSDNATQEFECLYFRKKAEFRVTVLASTYRDVQSGIDL